MERNEDALCLQQIYSHLGVEAYGEDIQEQAVKEIDRLKNKERKKAKQLAIKNKIETNSLNGFEKIKKRKPTTQKETPRITKEDCGRLL